MSPPNYLPNCHGSTLDAKILIKFALNLKCSEGDDTAEITKNQNSTDKILEI